MAGAAVLAIAYVAYKFRSFATMQLLAVGYLAHAAYDFCHDAYFVNAGIPAWWPEVCGSIDVLVGGYILHIWHLHCANRLLLPDNGFDRGAVSASFACCLGAPQAARYSCLGKCHG
jgi:hypothetical protein